jgi:hypothetical protein
MTASLTYLRLLLAGAARIRRAASGEHADERVGALNLTVAQSAERRRLLAGAGRGWLVGPDEGRVAYERLALGVGVAGLTDACAATTADGQRHDQQ